MAKPTPEQQRAWRAANKDKTRIHNKRGHDKRKNDPVYIQDARVRAAKHKNKLILENPVKLLLYAAKHRAEKRKVPFSINETDVPIPLACPLLGVWMTRKGPHAPSIDCIDPTKGYVSGNVWVVSKKANLMKNDATSFELENFARNVLSLLFPATKRAM